MRDFPTDVDALGRAVPVCEELPGWQEEIGEARLFDDLPASARRYVARIAELVEVPVCLVGVGPRRDQTVVLDAEMLDM